MELPFDLSEVLFITTANTTSTIPKPLLDRMEVIELPSYTDEEKLQIAKQHLLPKQLKRHGLKKNQLKITDDAIREVIVSYTRESGVRVLSESWGPCAGRWPWALSPSGISRPMSQGTPWRSSWGPESSIQRRMAWRTRWGWSTGWPGPPWGGTLLEAEVNVVPGSGKVELTGNLGNVMKESARAAFTYIRSRAVQLGVEPNFYKEKRHSHPLPRGRSAQGRPLRRSDHHHGHGLGPHRNSGSGRCGHDGRSHPPGPGSAHRRPAGKIHGGAAQRHPHGHHPQGQ